MRAALQRREALLQGVPGRVREAPVEELPSLRVGPVLFEVGVQPRDGERRREVDGRDDVVDAGPVEVFPSRDGAGVEAEVAIISHTTRASRTRHKPCRIADNTGVRAYYRGKFAPANDRSSTPVG